jgi:hypothetical protein
MSQNSGSYIPSGDIFKNFGILSVGFAGSTISGASGLPKQAPSICGRLQEFMSAEVSSTWEPEGFRDPELRDILLSQVGVFARDLVDS